MSPLFEFKNRFEAGSLLAAKLGAYKSGHDVVVLGLARGGIPVAAEVARALEAPLDVLVVRKLGAPAKPELAIGAIAADGARVLNQNAIREFSLSARAIDLIAKREQAEVERREHLYRGDRPRLDLKGRTLVLVDDGLATGSTMLAAARFARKESPRKLVLAVPVGSAQAIDLLRAEVDDSICLLAPEWLHSVGEWYRDFRQVTDAEVMTLLDQNSRLHAPTNH